MAFHPKIGKAFALPHCVSVLLKQRMIAEMELVRVSQRKGSRRVQKLTNRTAVMCCNRDWGGVFILHWNPCSKTTLFIKQSFFLKLFSLFF